MLERVTAVLRAATAYAILASLLWLAIEHGLAGPARLAVLMIGVNLLVSVLTAMDYTKLEQSRATYPRWFTKLTILFQISIGIYLTYSDGWWFTALACLLTAAIQHYKLTVPEKATCHQGHCPSCARLVQALRLFQELEDYFGNCEHPLAYKVKAFLKEDV